MALSEAVARRRHRDVWKFFANHPDQPAKPQDPEEREPGKDEEHAPAEININGNLAKGIHKYDFGPGKPTKADYYAWNAWNYIGSGGDKSRDIYGGASLECYRFYLQKYKPNFYQLFPCKKIADTPTKLAELDQAIADIKAIPSDQRDVNIRGENSYLGALRFRAVTQFQMAAAGTLKKKAKAGKAAAAKAPSETVGCAFPYRWQGHHVIAMNFFTQYLPTREYTLVRSSSYDINRGSNIIFLPEREADRHWHKVPNHLGSHPSYDDKVQELFADLKEKLEKAAAKPHPKAVEKLLKVLKATEDDAFKYIINVLGATGTVR